MPTCGFGWRRSCSVAARRLKRDIHAEQALRIQPNRTRVRQLLDEIARSTTP